MPAAKNPAVSGGAPWGSGCGKPDREALAVRSTLLTALLAGFLAALLSTLTGILRLLARFLLAALLLLAALIHLVVAIVTHVESPELAPLTERAGNDHCSAKPQANR
jgi:hypothetical protein